MYFVVSWFQKFVGSSQHWILLLLALILIIILGKKQYKGYIVGFVTLFIFVYICPITAKIITKYCMEENVYWRMFWILPFFILIAYGVTLLLQKINKKLLYGLALVFVLGLICITGSCIYGKEQFDFNTTKFKIPNKVIAACQIMKEYAEEGEMIKAVGDYDFVCYMRQYDASIKQPYGRYAPGYPLGEVILEEMNKERADIATLANAAENCRTNYIIYPSNEQEEQEFIAENYEPIGKVEAYTIYKFRYYVAES